MSLTLPFVLLDRYDVTAELGRGGHAIVYRAHDRVFDRAVAIKLLRDDALSPDILTRFRQEIQLTARLEHAHILHVYDTGTHEGLPYVVMELASGQTLADRLAREPQLPITDALQIAREVGLALAHAHARGIVHRDVKPENILLGASGAILADFGVARVTADQAVQRITSTGMAVGTLLYMSPEQLCAEPHVDERSDQYALACVLYEMLAGVRPHASATLEGLRMLRLTAQHAPVSAHRPSVSAAVEDALQVALAVTPADRFRNIDEFLAALGVMHTGDQAAVRLPSEGSRAGTRSRGRSGQALATAPAAAVERGTRHRRWVTGAVAAACAAMVAAAGWRWYAVANDRAHGGEAAGTLTAGVLPAVLAPLAPEADSLAVVFRDAVRDELAAWPGVVAAASDGDDASDAVYLLPRAVRLGGEVQLRLDVQGGEVASSSRWSIVRQVPAAGFTADASVRSMVREALAGRSAREMPGLELLADRSLPALRAYARGFAALRETGTLDSAQQAFRLARDAAPGFAPAHFWAAQTAAWAAPNAPDSWRTDADDAVRLGVLRGTDSLLAVALTALAARAYPGACAAYRAALERETRSFVAWYGLGQCQSLDRVVEMHRGRPQFRSSHWAALQAYLNAARHVPTSALMAALFPRMRRATYAGGYEVRDGRLTGTQEMFLAQPALVGDTLAFVPVPASRASDPASVPASWRNGLRRGRAMGVGLTEQWVRRFPDDARAWLEHALSLELAGRIDPRDAGSAPVALARIDTGQLSPALSARLATARARLLLRRGDTSGAFAEARRALASPLSDRAELRGALLPLAALVGNAEAVRRLAQPDSAARSTLPARLVDSLDAFRHAVLLGQCAELARLKPVLDDLIGSTLTAAEQTDLARRWLPPLYRGAVPCLGARVFRGLPAQRPLDSAVLTLAGGEASRALRILADSRARLVGATGGSITWDHQIVEVAVLLEAGDTVQAQRQLSAALGDVASMSLSTLDEPDQAAGLRQGLQLLRRLEARGRGGGAGTRSRQ